MGRSSSIPRIFRGIMGRQPSSKEAFELRSQLLLHGDLEAIARALVSSEEFSVQVLPQLVARWSAGYNGRRVFFVHVPKTAGTSVRLALANALGIPSINFYNSHQIPTTGSHFWPYLAGHAGVGAFPITHEGFTVFREPRSRLLSRYRQHQFEETTAAQRIPFEGADVGTSKTPGLKEPWKIWGGGRRLATFFYLDPLGRLPGNGATLRVASQIDSAALDPMSKEERIRGLRLGLSRINHSAWIHDADAVLDAIGAASGKRLAGLPRENSVEKNLGNPPHVQLTERDYEAFEMAVGRDQEVVELAVKMGVIPRLDPGEADHIFQDTLKRLNFSLP